MSLYIILALLAWLSGTALISAVLGGKKDCVGYFITFNAVVLAILLMGGAGILLITVVVGV